jgi:hypothetical protein
MPFLKTCRTCAVPVQIGKLYTWNSNGTITPKRDPGHRMLFYECKHLDRLFAGIEDLIGMSIERQIIESKSRSVIQYIKNERWWPRGALARSFVRPIVKRLHGRRDHQRLRPHRGQGAPLEERIPALPGHRALLVASLMW